MSSRSPRRKVSYFEPVPPRLARNIEPTFEVGCRFRCTMRVHCGQLYPSARDPAGTRRRYPLCPSTSTKRSLRTGALVAMRSISSPHCAWRSPKREVELSSVLGTSPIRSYKT
jgi:hypothetical protein